MVYFKEKLNKEKIKNNIKKINIKKIDSYLKKYPKGLKKIILNRINNFKDRKKADNKGKNRW